MAEHQAFDTGKFPWTPSFSGSSSGAHQCADSAAAAVWEKQDGRWAGAFDNVNDLSPQPQPSCRTTDSERANIQDRNQGGGRGELMRQGHQGGAERVWLPASPRSGWGSSSPSSTARGRSPSFGKSDSPPNNVNGPIPPRADAHEKEPAPTPTETPGGKTRYLKYHPPSPEDKKKVDVLDHGSEFIIVRREPPSPPRRLAATVDAAAPSTKEVGSPRTSMDSRRHKQEKDGRLKLCAPKHLAYQGCFKPGQAISLRPVFDGGQPSVFMVDPPLPEGLHLHPTTGIISGRLPPVGEVDARMHVITAANDAGYCECELTLSLLAPQLKERQLQPKEVQLYPEVSATAYVGEELWLLPHAKHSSFTAWSLHPDLPRGLALDPVTGAIGGVPIEEAPLADYKVSTSLGDQRISSSLRLSVAARRLTLSYAVAFGEKAAGGAAHLVPEVISTESSLPPQMNTTSRVFSIEPPLPQGISLCKDTGIIIVEPDAAVNLSTYRVRLRTPRFEASTELRFGVRAAAPVWRLSYPEASARYCVGQSMDLVPSTEGHALTHWAVEPPLPVGLRLCPSTGAISGAPQEVVHNRTWMVTARGPSGLQASASLTFAVQRAAPCRLSYPLLAREYSARRPVAVQPTVLGEVDSYSVSPHLPQGLELDPRTGELRGLPVRATPETTYEVTARNEAGAASVQLTFCVSVVAPRGLSYPQARARYRAGEAVRLVPRLDGGGAESWDVRPRLPPGLELDGSTGEIHGTLQVPAQVQCVITASNGAGSAVTLLAFAVDAALEPIGAAGQAHTPTGAVAVALPRGLQLVLEPAANVVGSLPAQTSDYARVAATAISASHVAQGSGLSGGASGQATSPDGRRAAEALGRSPGGLAGVLGGNQNCTWMCACLNAKDNGDREAFLAALKAAKDAAVQREAMAEARCRAEDAAAQRDAMPDARRLPQEPDMRDPQKLRAAHYEEELQRRVAELHGLRPLGAALPGSPTSPSKEPAAVQAAHWQEAVHEAQERREAIQAIQAKQKEVEERAAREAQAKRKEAEEREAKLREEREEAKREARRLKNRVPNSPGRSSSVGAGSSYAGSPLAGSPTGWSQGWPLAGSPRGSPAPDAARRAPAFGSPEPGAAYSQKAVNPRISSRETASPTGPMAQVARDWLPHVKIEFTRGGIEQAKTMGNALFAQGSVPESVEWFSKAIWLVESRQVADVPASLHSILRSNRAFAFATLQKWKEAEEDATAAVALNPANTKARYRRAAARLELGRVQGAFDDVEQVLLELNGDDDNKREAITLREKIAKHLEQDAVKRRPPTGEGQEPEANSLRGRDGAPPAEEDAAKRGPPMGEGQEPEANSLRSRDGAPPAEEGVPGLPTGRPSLRRTLSAPMLPAANSTGPSRAKSWGVLYSLADGVATSTADKEEDVCMDQAEYLRKLASRLEATEDSEPVDQADYLEKLAAQLEAGEERDDAERAAQKPCEEPTAVEPEATYLLLAAEVTNNSNLRKIRDVRRIMQAAGIAFIEVDASHKNNKEFRDKLWDISGRRAEYPQVFFRSKGTYVFVGGHSDVQCANEISAMLKENPELASRREGYGCSLQELFNHRAEAAPLSSGGRP